MRKVGAIARYDDHNEYPEVTIMWFFLANQIVSQNQENRPNRYNRPVTMWELIIAIFTL